VQSRVHVRGLIAYRGWTLPWLNFSQGHYALPIAWGVINTPTRHMPNTDPISDYWSPDARIAVYFFLCKR
jgi:hypothetical protein